MLTNEFVKDVCKIGQGHKTCRYLVRKPQEWMCCKLIEGAKKYFDGRVSRGTMYAVGDNCGGVDDGDPSVRYT
jgi:hypothetical protein